MLEIDLLFAVGTFSSNADNIFQKFQETITFAIDAYGTKSIHSTIFARSSDDTVSSVVGFWFTVIKLLY